MLTRVLVLVALHTSLQPHPAIVLGLVERDLTGDATPETLRVVGVGATPDHLDVTFTIESEGKTIYTYRLTPLTRTVGFDAARRIVSAEEHRARVKDFGRWFFDEQKFERPLDFVDGLRGMAPRLVAQIPDVIARDRPSPDTRSGQEIWDEIVNSPVTIFRFSPGGDTVVAIGWSARAGRFYQLLNCC